MRETKERAKATEETKVRARMKERPRLVKEGKQEVFDSSSRPLFEVWSLGTHERTKCPQKQVNAVSVAVMPASPPVQSSASRGCLIFCLCVKIPEHACNRDFSLRGTVLSQPRCVMGDVSGNVINNSGTNTLDIKLGGPSSQANCRVALQVGTVANRCSIRWQSVGLNCRLKLDSDSCGGSNFVHEAHSGPCPVETKSSPSA